MLQYIGMKDVRLEVIRARMKKGASYTALFTMDPLYGLLHELDGKRVTIKNISKIGKYRYRVYIVESTHPINSHELSEWREE